MASLVSELPSSEDEITWHGTVAKEGLSSMSLRRTVSLARGRAMASFARPSGQGPTRRIPAIFRGSIWERGDGSRLLEISIMGGWSVHVFDTNYKNFAPKFSESITAAPRDLI